MTDKPDATVTVPPSSICTEEVTLKAEPDSQQGNEDCGTDPSDRFFRTDQLMADLKGRTVRGGAITLGAQGIKFALQTATTMVLARLLTPADFGLVAMVTAVTGFVAMFKDAGLSMATVQREHITHGQVSTLFWINVALSALLMLITAGFAPAIAWIYGEPRLVWITLAVASTFIIGGLSVQHTALLRRQMRFKALAVIEILSMAAGVATAIVISWYTRNYWALVAMSIVGTMVTCLAVWITSGWIPGLPRRGAGVMPLVKFGGKITGASTVNYLARNADNVLIGWAWGADLLGVYAKAYALLTLPMRQITGPMSAVMLPTLSRLQDDPHGYRRAYLRATSALALVSASIVGACFVFADQVILLVLGDQWSRAALIFRLLSPAAFVSGVSVATGWAYVSLNKADRQLRWNLIATPILVASFIVGLPWGPEGVAACYSVSFVIMWTWAIFYCFKGHSMSAREVIWAAARPIIASSFAVASSSGILMAQSLFGIGAVPLFTAGIVYVLVFLGTIYLIPEGKKDLMEAVKLLSMIRGKRC